MGIAAAPPSGGELFPPFCVPCDTPAVSHAYHAQTSAITNRRVGWRHYLGSAYALAFWEICRPFYNSKFPGADVLISGEGHKIWDSLSYHQASLRIDHATQPPSKSIYSLSYFVKLIWLYNTIKIELHSISCSIKFLLEVVLQWKEWQGVDYILYGVIFTRIHGDWPGKPSSLARQVGHLLGCGGWTGASTRHSTTHGNFKHPAQGKINSVLATGIGKPKSPGLFILELA